MSSKLSVVIFGAGNFALGGALAIPGIDGKCDITIVTRRPQSEASERRLNAVRANGGYYVRPDGEYEQFFVTVNRILYSDDQSYFPRLAELFKRPLIVVTSVGKSNQPNVAGLISKAILEAGDSPTLSGVPIFRFENELHECWDEVSAVASPRRLYMPPMVVDRISRKYTILDNSSDHSATLVVEPENYRRIECSLPDFDGESLGWREMVAEFCDAFDVQIRDDIAKYATLKAWNINGAQAAICAYAKKSRHNSLREYFADADCEGSRLLEKINHEFKWASRIALGKSIPLSEIDEFCAASFERIRNADDNVDGILHQWGKNNDAHLTKLERRLGDAIRVLEGPGRKLGVVTGREVNEGVVKRAFQILSDPPPTDVPRHRN